MFTGIVEEVGRVTGVQPDRMTIAAGDLLRDVAEGDSMAVNGVCLTITGFNSSSFTVDLMAETVSRSNLGLLRPGDRVNLERPLTLNGRLGGHLVQGHIDATGRVSSIRRDAGAMLIRFVAPPEVMRYVVEKGFIAVDGASLTVVDRDSGSLQVSVVGYTRRHTTLGDSQVGNRVNLEVDIIAKYVEQLSGAPHEGITASFLQEHGFLVN